MKRTRVFFAALVLAWVGASLFRSAHAQTSAIGTVVAVEGDVTVQLVGGGEPRKVQQGDILRAGERIQSSPNGRVRLVMKDESVLILGPGTTLDFSAFDYDEVRGTRTSVLNVLGGTLRAIVSKLKAYGNRFEIRTPTATVHVRGTHLMVDIAPDTGETRVLVVDGRAVVTHSDPAVAGQTSLGSMEQSEVREGQPPSKGHVATDQDLESMREQTDVPFNRTIVRAMDPLTLPGPVNIGSPLARQSMLDDLVTPPAVATESPQTRQDPTKGTIEIRW